MEYADGGNLEDFVATATFKCLQWTEKMQLAKGIAEGVKCLHNNKILHRDLVSDQ